MLGAAVLLAALVATCVPHVATRYGVQFNGQGMYCPPYAPYLSTDETIIAVSETSLYSCGNRLVVVGSFGYIVGTVQDRCGGCGQQHIDLSEAGLWKICGDQADRCEVKVFGPLE